MSSFIPSDQLSFDQYKSSLKTFLKAQDRFSDYDFEGSNISVLVDLLSYNAFNQGYYLNMVGSEMFLDTADMRESIVSRAKELNYTPRSRISARTQVVVEVVPNDSPTSILIPKGYTFKSTTSTGTSIKFSTNQVNIITKNDQGRYISDPFYVYEGVNVTESFVVGQTTATNNTTRYNQRFAMQSPNIDATSIEVTVFKGGNVLNRISFEKAYNLYGLSDKSNIYFVRGFKDNLYEVEFGDGILGAALSASDLVQIQYRDSVGSDGNGNYILTKGTAIDGYSTINVSTIQRVDGGAERESNDSIKYNSVRHFQVQDRAVIESDYKVLIETNFPEIQQVNAYGGEKVFKYGRVIVVLKPHNIEGVVDESVKQRIIDFIKTKSMVPQTIIEDPEYYYLGIKGNIFYSSNQVQSPVNMIKADIIASLVNLNETTLSKFNTVVYQSHINQVIDSSNATILGSDIELSMIRKLQPIFGLNKTYSFITNNTIKKSEYGEYQSDQYYGIRSSPFSMILDDEVSTVVIQDNGIGRLFLFKIVEGVKVKQPISVGTVKYDTGEVTFTIDIYQTTPNFKITCITTSNSIAVDLNKFISIDGSDIDLNMVAR